MAIADFLNTILQAMLMSYIPYYFTSRNPETKENNKISKMVLCTFLIFAFIFIFSMSIGDSVISVFVMHITNLIIISIFYYNHKVKAICAYSVIHLILQISALICGSLYWGYIRHIESIGNMDIIALISIYIPLYILSYFIIKYKDKLYRFYLNIVRKRHYIEILLLITLAFDYLSSISWFIHGNDNGIFKNLFILLLVISIIASCVYLTGLKNKIYEIKMLNESISIKNNELRKVKHDFGSQISYLYGLCLMDKYERVEELLKEIIERNDNIPNNIELLNSSDSLMSTIIKPLVPSSVNVIIDETYSLNDTNISEFDLQKIISNIVNNGVSAMNSRGIITVKVYKIFNSAYIKIQNTGPKIDKNIIDKIFDEGFSTKNSSDNGFGLAIVKELVTKNNGQIYVESTNESTEFKIIFNLK